MRRDRRRRPGRTSSRRQHAIGLAASAVCALLAATLIGIGVVAWTMERPPAVSLHNNETVTLGTTPWFDPGSTLFAAPIGDERSPQPPPAAWSCTLTDEARSTELIRRPDASVVGTRVVDGVSVTPVVTIGPTRAGAQLLCTGPASQATSVMWVLPTNPGSPRTPLSLVVGGIALAGLAAVVHPRARNLRPFER